MVCNTCGSSLTNEVHFCPKCGAQVVGVQPMYAAYPPPSAIPVYGPAPRVQRNLQIVGVLWCVFGVYRVVQGLIGMFFLRVMSMHDGAGWSHWGRFNGPFGPPPWMHSVLPVVAVVTVLASALALLVGFGLLTRQSWGRTLAIVVAILSLIKFPFGTALGIYTLWVLAPSESGAEYEAIVDRS